VKKWLTLEELAEAATPISLINEPIVEAESASARAQRIWFNRRETEYGRRPAE
jgi:hypothetical protein